MISEAGVALVTMPANVGIKKRRDPILVITTGGSDESVAGARHPNPDPSGTGSSQ